MATMAALAATMFAGQVLGPQPVLAGEAAVAAKVQSRPSFNCARASTRVERLICGNTYLGQLDREMARAYQVLQTQVPASELRALRADQRTWLADRDACVSVDCLIVASQDRIEFLGGSY